MSWRWTVTGNSVNTVSTVPNFETMPNNGNGGEVVVSDTGKSTVPFQK